MTPSLPELELRLLRAFQAVAEERHFGRAARRLHVSQPPLSMSIRKLETVIGVRLFERDRRHVELTEAGAFLLERTRHLLSESARACDQARRIARGETGTLALGYTPTASYEVLPRLIPAFRKARPDVKLELIELRSAWQPDALRSRRIEVGFACGPVGADGLEEQNLTREPLLLALSRKNALAARKRLYLRDLEAQPFVLVRPDLEPAWAEAALAALRRVRIEPLVAQETDSKLAMLGLVAADVGVSLVSASSAQLLRRGVVLRPIVDLKLRVALVTLSLPTPSPRARELLSLAQRASS
jgi:LysR family transcriptional regulator, benzoate and cis,cis-muconate-responsive activator of ben and cat genes